MLILLLFRKNELPLLPQKYKEGHYGLDSSSNSFRTYGVFFTNPSFLPHRPQVHI